MIERAIDILKANGYEGFELSGVLMIPVSSSEKLDQIAKDVRRLLESVGYNKSWALNPYYYENHKEKEIYNA